MYFGAEVSDFKIAKKKKRSEIVPVRDMKAYQGVAPFILNLSTRRRPSKHRMRVWFGAPVRDPKIAKVHSMALPWGAEV